MGFWKKLFPSYSEREIKDITPTVDKIEALADAYAEMSDDELRETISKNAGELAVVDANKLIYNEIINLVSRKEKNK